MHVSRILRKIIYCYISSDNKNDRQTFVYDSNDK